MLTLQARNISKSYGEKQLFTDLTFDIHNNDRIGLVGHNGAGKTTLANIIYGSLEADTGTVHCKHDIKIGYLKQSIEYMMNDIGSLSGEFMEKASELGLKKVQTWEKERMNHLSGGEKLKFSLAEVWSTHPDILILDEPTNHLDLYGINWLVEKLASFHGAVIIISHDRYFLDKTVTRIFDIENSKLTVYDGNYSTFYEKKKKYQEEQLHRYNIQQHEKKRIESQMSQLQQWAGKAHRTMRDQEGFKEFHGVKAKKLDKAIKSKMKRLNKELDKNKIDKPLEEMSVRFQFEGNKKHGKRLIEAKNLSKSFHSRSVFKSSYFYINHGERIGLVGPNGCGKTTFLRMLLGDEPITTGDLSKSPSLKIAYLSQDVADLPLFRTVHETLNLNDKNKLLKARTALANMGIKASKLNQPIHSLSLGERTKVKLTNLLLDEYDLLILDEPTNHLDLASRNQLEQTLSEFPGTILVVSHDYYFLNSVCEKLLVFEEQKIKRIEMTIEEYEVKKQQTKKSNKNQSIEEELLVVNTEISAILGELSLLTPESEKYHELDISFQLLTKRRRELMNR
ncbi:ribosomal protection-like ABC-F family protein [Metabacillus endolithicus]|uniref:Ribosomal protection-like ABC-F family protein n=1 Tax=Metabacillus endolithicus TaxID=1535204 RepID=A0ABW5BWZ9_9BACI|nr:ABC-F type ribosomal protection protein [Metabacillus endolithicus]UPG65970.1 ABC-F type ribosomal protection protein [Metabacillus endolithicus]